MLCYKDQTFCDFYTECKDGDTCGRALTPKVQEDADKWWGGEGSPICLFVDAPECMVGK